jgi:hypothetical protein
VKDPNLIRQLEQTGDPVKLFWNGDLLAPQAVGLHFSRYGTRVLVSQENIDLAKAELAKGGATDILFTARRVDSFDARDWHYVLVSFEIVPQDR